MTHLNLKPGDSVKVKSGILEPNNKKLEIGGWQGYVVDIKRKRNAENTLVTIEWDSVTLQKIPEKYIIETSVEGLSWQTMVLHDTDLEEATARDNLKTLRRIQNKLEDKYYWSSFGAEGLRIEKVLEGANNNDERECMLRWFNYMELNLTFPFKAEVSLESYSTTIRDGDIVTVKGLNDFVDLYGILAITLFERKRLYIPLVELIVIDEKSNNYQLTNDYNTWFSNK
jgi:hypothetical protein